LLSCHRHTRQEAFPGKSQPAQPRESILRRQITYVRTFQQKKKKVKYKQILARSVVMPQASPPPQPLQQERQPDPPLPSQPSPPTPSSFPFLSRVHVGTTRILNLHTISPSPRSHPLLQSRPALRAWKKENEGRRNKPPLCLLLRNCRTSLNGPPTTLNSLRGVNMRMPECSFTAWQSLRALVTWRRAVSALRARSSLCKKLISGFW